VILPGDPPASEQGYSSASTRQGHALILCAVPGLRNTRRINRLSGR
jgi:hypothetical protein